MGGVDANKKTASYSVESALEVAYRELSARLDGTAVSPGDLKDQVVECGPQVVSNLAEQNSKNSIDSDWPRSGLNIVGLVRIELNDHGIVVELPEGCFPAPEIIDVLYCPIDPVERVLKRVG